MPSYTSNFIAGGTASADVANLPASNAVDGNTATYWQSTSSTGPHWWKYDLGSGVTKKAAKLRIYPPDYGSSRMKTVTLQASNDNSTWTDIYSVPWADAGVVWQEFTFTPPATAYRYYRIYMANDWYGADGQYKALAEVQMMELGPTTYTHTISVTATASARMGRKLFSRISVTASALPTIAAARIYTQLISVAASAQSSILKIATYYRTISVAATASAFASQVVQLISRALPKHAAHRMQSHQPQGNSKVTRPSGTAKHDKPQV